VPAGAAAGGTHIHPSRRERRFGAGGRAGERAAALWQAVGGSSRVARTRHLAGFGTRPDAGADIKGLWLDETMLLWGRAWRAGV